MIDPVIEATWPFPQKFEESREVSLSAHKSYDLRLKLTCKASNAGSSFHNTGNDARFTVQATLIIAILGYDS